MLPSASGTQGDRGERLSPGGGWDWSDVHRALVPLGPRTRSLQPALDKSGLQPFQTGQQQGPLKDKSHSSLPSPCPQPVPGGCSCSIPGQGPP